MSFSKWINAARKELRAAYDADPTAETTGPLAGRIGNEASKRAANERLHDCIEHWSEQNSDSLAVDAYLVRCLAAIERIESERNPRLLTPGDVACRTGSSVDTVLNWIRTGFLKASDVATGERPRYVIRPEDYQSFLRSRAVIGD